MYGFTYSQRPFTPALNLADDVSDEEKGRRLQRLFSVVDEQKMTHLGRLVGAEQEVLIEGRSKTGDLTGRSERNEIVHLKAGTELDGVDAGALVRVQVLEAFKNSLAAQVLKVVVPAPRIPSAVVRSQLVTPPSDLGGKTRLNVVA